MANVLKNVDGIETSSGEILDLEAGIGAAIVASGGNESVEDGVKIHKFTSSGTFTVTTGGKADILIVAGGGASGSSGAAGGGAGGAIPLDQHELTPGSYTIVVGGGAPSNGSIWSTSGPGGDSSAFGQTAKGGGSGPGGYSGNGGTGGSGGGGRLSLPNNETSSTTSGGAGTTGQGNKGGDAYPNYGGGGGGYSEEGVGFMGTHSSEGGGPNSKGGDGINWPPGSNDWYAGGGGGGSTIANASPGATINDGQGGKGGGGGGQVATNWRGSRLRDPSHGASNTGGGAGAMVCVFDHFYRNGGSGVVIIRYPEAPNLEV